jgi:hypothetical protein
MTCPAYVYAFKVCCGWGHGAGEVWPRDRTCRTAETAGLNRLDAGHRFEMQFHTEISYHVPR